MSSNTSVKIISECKEKLLAAKSDILNRMIESKREYFSRDKGLDEGDQSMANLAESDFLLTQERLRKQILEIELALSRIERGTFGICEETEEPIEAERLLAIPWTRLSIEGAEIQEAMKRKFAIK
ncbi:MAG: TraR/DksA family transcriptional regulator [Bdellovibrionales bacterium]|nr:TraR/DksA family transcriptional regulator [Bdellovibrionales bacterium]